MTNSNTLSVSQPEYRNRYKAWQTCEDCEERCCLTRGALSCLLTMLPADRGSVRRSVEKRYLKVKSGHLIPDRQVRSCAAPVLSVNLLSAGMIGSMVRIAAMRDRDRSGRGALDVERKSESPAPLFSTGPVAILRSQPVSGLNLYLTSPSMLAVRISVQ